jgi:cell division protease FtsH
MDKKTQLNLWFAAAAFAALLLFQFATATTTYEPIPYSQYQSYLKEGKIEEVVIHQDRIEGKLKETKFNPEGEENDTSFRGLIRVDIQPFVQT